jgi:hypothetical protein
VAAGLPPGAYEALADAWPPSRVWSLLMEVAAARAARRRGADIAGQWERDRFVQPSIVDQRQLLEVDRHLFAAASGFDAIELSPVAPLGVCSTMARASQHKVLSALRGTEVVADPTNVMALECARRLRRDASTTVRLATSHRCVRAQPVPEGKGLTASFRIFCLASSALEQADHAFVVNALADHVNTLLGALDRLERDGFAFAGRRVTLLAAAARVEIADRVAARIAHAPIARAPLEHPYYSGGLRFQIDARAPGGGDLPLADGGVFDWVAALLSNRRAVYVASGFGSQLAAFRFRTAAST